jgi:hypothetical protein
MGLLDYVWERLWARLDGIADDEYLWWPAPDCWTVNADGAVDHEGPERVTTIAWRTWHIGSDCVDGFASRLFGARALDLEPYDWYANAADALLALHMAWSGFRTGYAALDDGAMAQPLGPRFGPFADNNHADLLLHVGDEVIHHGAEIALLRDLYAARTD